MQLGKDNMLSVIIPVYNVENYLPTCLESVLSQSYENMEIIIVDDGSSDSSGEICDCYAARDPRITVYHTLNSGVSAARNLALAKARGKWITFVDSDDLVPPHTFRTFVSVAEKEKLDMVIGGVRFDLNPEGSEIFTESFSSYTYRSDDSEAYVREAVRNFKMSFWGKIYSKELLCDIRFPLGIPNYEDYTVLWQLALKRPTYATVSHIGYIARCRQGSASRSYNGLPTYRKRIASLTYACRKMKELFIGFPSIRKDLTRFVIAEGLGCKALYGHFMDEDKKEVVALTKSLWNFMLDTCSVPWYVRGPFVWRVRTVGRDINRFPRIQYAAIRVALRLI